MREGLLKPKSVLRPAVVKSIVESPLPDKDKTALTIEARQQRLTDYEAKKRVEQAEASRMQASITIPIQRGQWLVETITKSTANLMAINVQSYKELTEPQREKILDLLIRLQKRTAEWISYLEGVKIIDVD